MEDKAYTDKPDDFIYKDINETEAIDYLLNSFEGGGTHSDLNVFSNVLYGKSYFDSWRKYKGCYVLRNFLLREIPLFKTGKPGEIDILLIPFDAENIYYEQTAVFEVKVLKPDNDNRYKGANSDGYNQVMGLVELGFPLIGLIHVVVSKPLPEDSKPDITFAKRPANAVDTPDKKWPSVDEVEFIKWDWLPFHSSNVQMKRLLKYDIPKYVGLKVISLNFNKGGGYGLGYTADMQEFERGFLSPHTRETTIELIKNHHRDKPNKYYLLEFKFP